MRAKEIEVCPVIERECPYFSCLNESLEKINREARTAALDGREIAGMHSTMCGSCVITERNKKASDKGIEALIKHQSHEQT